MNKHCYRMVFNKARGILMAVAEIAVSQGKASGETSGKTVMAGAVRGSAFRALTFSAWATLAVNIAGLVMWSAPAMAQGQIVADPNAPANQRPTVLAAPNGVPLVNIQTPSAAGVSRNTYSQFDVQQQGVILNNSRMDAQTQLGGWVQGNPWLATGSARVILNEVNSNNPSLLQGYVEVAGSRAQVVIANPAGVTCDGCGFINASRATVTTGTPILSGGNLEGYRVQGGAINITGAGLDASTADYTDLIARSVQVNAGIWANQLKITAGANQVDAEHTAAAPIAGTGAAPAFAIDVAQLGGMYAGKITLVGTEAGVGVRNAGHIGASVGEVIVTAEGRLENAGRITSATHTQVDTSGGIDNSGTIYAQGNASLGTRDNIDNSGLIAALGNATLTATGANSRITSTNNSVLGAGVQADGSIGNSGALSLNASKTLTAQGQNLSGSGQTWAAQAINLSGSETVANGDIAVIATVGDIDHTGGNLQANGSVVLTAANAITNDNGVIIGRQLTINGDSLSNRGGSISQFGSADTRITTAGAIDNNGGVLASNGQNMFLQADSLNNNGGVLFALGNLTVNQPGGTLRNAGGYIGASGDIDLAVTGLDNTNGWLGTMQNSGGNIGVLAIGNVTNTGGEIASDQDLRLTANTLVGEGAVIGGRDASLSLQGDYTQTAGNLITANRDLSFSITGNLTNTGTLQATGNLAVNAANITNQGELGAGGTLSADTATLRNTGSIVGGDVAITASQKIENVGPSALIGASNALGKLELLAPTIENRDETTATDTSALTTIYGQGQVVLAGSKDAVSGQYASASQVVNRSGLIQSGGDMSIYADTLTNTRRVLVASDTFTQVGQSSGTVVWTVANPDVPGGRYIEPPHEGTMNSHYVQTDYTETLYRNSVISISPEAQIISGGNLNPAVNLLQNYWSKVTATGDISLNGVTLDQDSWRGATPYLQRAVYNGTYLYLTYKSNPWRMAWPGPETTDTPLSGYDASFVAQGNISGSGATIHNTAGSTTATPLGAQAAAGVMAGAVGQAPVLANLGLPSGGLFHTNTDAQARYLVETNPAFADRQAWLSSDWYFQQLRLDPAMIQKRLGDGFYEQKLVREEILSLTGKAMLGGYASEEAQFREMMTAGAALVQALNIRPGISLNAEQVAKLTSNVIIMETRVVDGNSVLVPVVYLARINQDDLLPTGSMIAATNINLANTKGFTNSGTIKANNALTLSGQDIDNRGGNLQSGGLMALNTAGDIDLTSASVKAGSLQLQAVHDLKLNTDAKTISVTGPGGTRTSTMLGRVASLEVAGDAQIQTGGNLEQKGAQLKVGGDLATDIQGDWQIGTQQTRETTRVNRMGGHSNTDTVQNVGSVIQVGGQSDIKTGGNLIAQGAQIDLQGGGSIQAGGSVELQAVKNSFNLDATSASKGSSSSLKTYDETVVGTSLQSGKSLTIQSGKDIRLAGSTLTVAEGSATLAAAGDVTIQAETEQHTYDWQHSGKHSGIVSTKTTTERDHRDAQIAVGSTLSADGVTIQSGKDIAVTGSNVVATNDVTLTAQNNVKIEAATNTLQESHFREEKKSGLLSSGGIGFTLGSQQQSTDAKGTSTMAVASTVGSTQGNVTIAAGNDYKQVGSNVVAPQGDIDISAKKIDIIEAQNTSLNTTETKFKQSGITLALTSPVISAVQTVQHMGEVAGQAKDARMQALAGATAGMAAYDAYGKVQAGQGQTIKGKDNQIVTDRDANGNVTGTRDANAADKVGGINVSISVGSSKSQSNSSHTSSTAQGSTVAAGNNVNITATGAGKDSDLTVQGSQITAGNNATLKADDQLNLLAAQSTSEQHSTNKSSSGSVGISYGSDGLLLTVGASGGRGKADGSDVTQTNTHVDAGNQLILQSGNDTTLKGAVATGKQVVADVGGNLNIESLQDTSQYDSKQKSMGGSISVGYGKMSGSFSSSKSNANSDYASVVEQSGIKAGDEGFQVSVNGNTDLQGAVIASTDKAVLDGKNSLTTATLTTSDIANHAEASASSSGINLDSSMFTQSKYGIAKGVIGNALNNASESGSSYGQTRSAVSEGTVTITDQTGQQQRTGQTAEQAVASLNRDTANTQTSAQKQDVLAMERTVAADRAIKEAVYKEAVKFTDESYRTAVLKKAEMYELGRDKDGNITRRALSESEKMELKPGADGKVHIVDNGIFNDAAYASGNALQHSATNEPLYLIHFPEADNGISELLVAGYQKFLEGDALGLTNATQETKNIMNTYGQQGLLLDGHSRGSITIENAMASIENQANAVGSLSGTYVNFFGPAQNVLNADNTLATLQNRDAVTDLATKNSMVIHYMVHEADPVGTLLGLNDPTGGTVPDGSSVVKEQFRAATGQANTSHNLYFTNEVNFKPGLNDLKRQELIDSYWGGKTPVLVPVRTYPATSSQQEAK
jgi:filamentous hemagglutinin